MVPEGRHPPWTRWASQRQEWGPQVISVGKYYHNTYITPCIYISRFYSNLTFILLLTPQSINLSNVAGLYIMRSQGDDVLK